MFIFFQKQFIRSFILFLDSQIDISQLKVHVFHDYSYTATSCSYIERVESTIAVDHTAKNIDKQFQKMAPAVYMLFFGVICGISHCPVCAQDPCASYSVLNDESRSVLKMSSSYTLDNYISGWHRFMGKAGDKMLDYPPTPGQGHRCAANVPGYLSGQHPRGSDGVVSRTVCFVYSGNTCWSPTTIQVKNCGNYFVYNLNALTSGSYMRYCGSGEVGKYLLANMHTYVIFQSSFRCL